MDYKSSRKAREENLKMLSKLRAEKDQAITTDFQGNVINIKQFKPSIKVNQVQISLVGGTNRLSEKDAKNKAYRQLEQQIKKQVRNCTES